MKISPLYWLVAVPGFDCFYPIFGRGPFWVTAMCTPEFLREILGSYGIAGIALDAGRNMSMYEALE